MLKSTGYFHIIAIAVMVFSCSMVGYSTWCGAGFTYDSQDYFAASRSWRLAKELLNDNGSLYVFHAPLFPIILSAIGENFSKVYFILNLTICCLSVSLLCFTTRSFFHNSILHVVFLASTILSVGFQMIHHFLWTEPLFLLLFVVHNYFLFRYVESGASKDFWLLIMMGLLMGITKNTGFFIILGTGLALLIQDKGKKYKSAATYGVLASLGFVLWNLTVVLFRQGGSMYRDSSFLQGFLANLYNYSDVISLWFLPAIIPLGLRLSILFMIGLLLFYYALKRPIGNQTVSLLLQVATYIMIMIIIIQVDYDEIERLLAVIMPWSVLVILLLLDRISSIWVGKSKTVLLVVLLLFLSYTSIRSLSNVEMWHHNRCRQENLSNN